MPPLGHTIGISACLVFGAADVLVINLRLAPEALRAPGDAVVAAAPPVAANPSPTPPLLPAPSPATVAPPPSPPPVAPAPAPAPAPPPVAVERPRAPAPAPVKPPSPSPPPAPVTIHFATGDAELDATARRALDELAAA